MNILSFLVSAVGLIVMFGWIFCIDFLKSIHPDFVSMKFYTALCFFIAGFLSYALNKQASCLSVKLHTCLSTATLALFTLTIMEIANPALFSNVVFEENAIKSVAPGVPSISTMFAFLLLASAGLRYAFMNGGITVYVKAIGWHLKIISGCALVGYLLDKPILYYYVPGISSAMAIHTAVLFFVLGICLANSQREELVYVRKNEPIGAH